MNDQAPPSQRRRGPPLRAILPTLVVVVIGVVWSLFWFAGAWWLERGMADARAELADQGTELICIEDEIKGYPFRFTFDCLGATIRTPELTIALPRIAATVQAYDPRYLIAELEGPGRLEQPGGAATDADWDRLLVSARTEFGLLRAVASGREADPTRLLTELGLTGVALTVNHAGNEGRLDRLVAFARPAPDAPSRDVEIAFDIDALVLEELAQPIDLVLRSRLFALPPADSPSYLATWLGGDGAIGLTRLDMSGETAVLRLSGRIDAAPTGALEAAVELGLAGPSAVPALAADEGLRGLLAVVSNALLLTGRPGEIDGQDALFVDLQVDDGDARLGLIPLGSLPPLF